MKRSVKIIVLVLSLLFVGFTYFIDVDAPTELAGHIQTALDAWLELDDELVFEEATELAEAEAVLAVADAALFGPDLLSLSTQQQDETRQHKVLVAPTEIANQRVLRHEVGLLLDLRVGTQGIMNPSILPDDSAELSDADLEVLSATLNAAKEDINRDGLVDYYDLVALAQAFGASGFEAAADLNEDGIVDREDLNLLRAAYSFTSPAVNPPSTSEPNQDADPEQDPNNPDNPNPDDLNPELDPNNPDATATEGEPSNEGEETASPEEESPTDAPADETTPDETTPEGNPENGPEGKPEDTDEGSAPAKPNDPNQSPDSP